MRAWTRVSFLVNSLIILSFLFAIPAGAVSARKADSAVSNEATVSLTGWFSIVWGDSDQGVSLARYMLSDDTGKVSELTLDESQVASLGGVLALDRKYVSLAGVLDETTAGLKVTSISLASQPGTDALGGGVSQAVTGSKPWISVMCRFSDFLVEPKTLSFFQGMYSNVKGGLDHYWREQSNDIVNVAGSTAYGWVALPHPEIYYNPTDSQGGTNLDLLANDCLGAVDANVNFAPYSGINMMFNTNFDNGFAWGGTKYMTLDGVTKVWSITWEPTWGYDNVSVIAHEMGHGFGLPHSSGNYGNPYDNAWDVMSQDRYNCAAATDPTYGCLAQHTIAYYKYILGWVSPAERYMASISSKATINLEQLAMPTTSDYKLAQIPIGGSSTHFYTVEARRKVGYDIKLPGNAVIIHEVDTSRGIPAHVLDVDLNGNTSDAGTMWIAGETFTDIPNGITVRVDAATATGFQVTIGGLSPDNDEFALPVIVSSPSFTQSQSTTTASTAADDPYFTTPCVASSAHLYNTVWYRYTPTITGTLSVNTSGSNYDTVLAVWTGSTPAALVLAGCNDNTNGDQSKVEIPVTAGVTYQIEVASHTGGGGQLKLNTLDSYALTVVRNGSGTVTSSPEGINCGTDCSHNYTYDTGVTLTAVAAPGAAFTGWSGICSGTSTCVVTMNQIRSVTANFTTLQYALTVNKTGSGTGTVTSTNVTGITCGADCTENYNYNTSVTLSASSDAGSTFTAWSGACTGSGSCVVNMTTARAVTANFVRLPGPFTMDAPANLATGQFSSLRLSWFASGGAISYEYCLSINASLCAPWVSVGTQTGVDVSGLAKGVKYYWNVRAKNLIGYTYATDGQRSFTTGSIPAAFLKTSPANSASALQTPNQTLRWATSAGAARYEYCFDITNDKLCANNLWVNVGTNTSVDLTGQLLSNKVYYWQVRSVNEFGTQSANTGLWWAFKTRPLPVAPVLVSPVSAFQTNNATPTLSWKAAASANTYQVEISLSSSFAVKVQTNTGAPGVLTYTTLPLAGGKYYWHVRAINLNSEGGAWSASRTFTVDVTAPPVPVLSFPSAGASFSVTPPFKWFASSGAFRYQFQIDNDADFSSPVNTSPELSGLSYTPPGLTSGVYYWRVRVRDAVGNWSAWSTSRQATKL